MVRKTYSGVAIALVALFIGGVLGWGFKSTVLAGTPLPVSNLPMVGIGGGPGTSSNDATNVVSLNNLLVQHTVLMTLHLQEVYDGKDTSASSQQIKDTGQQIANLIGGQYGDSAKNDFLSLWQKYVTEYEDYARALKSNDANTMTTAKTNLANLSDEMGGYLNTVDSDISPTQVTTMMNDHVMLTLSTVDAYARKDQGAVDRQIKAASDQATEFAAYLIQVSSPTQAPVY